MGSCSRRAGRANARTCLSTGSSLQGASATKWCIDWCLLRTLRGSRRAAIGSTLLRSPGSISPVV